MKHYVRPLIRLKFSGRNWECFRACACISNLFQIILCLVWRRKTDSERSVIFLLGIILALGVAHVLTQGLLEAANQGSLWGLDPVLDLEAAPDPGGVRESAVRLQWRKQSFCWKQV